MFGWPGAEQCGERPEDYDEHGSLTSEGRRRRGLLP